MTSRFFSSWAPSGRLAIAVLLLILSTACAPARMAPDPEKAAAFATRGEHLARDHNYAEAAEQLVLASHHQPDNPDRLLRAGELLEAAGRWQDAADLYTDGLQNPAMAKAHDVMAYRFGLIASRHLEQPSRARQQLALLPPDSVYAADLKAMIELGLNDTRAALNRLQQALPYATDNDTKGTLSYHLALAYHRLGQQAEAARALYDAINLTRHRGTVEEIKRLWNEMNIR